MARASSIRAGVAAGAAVVQTLAQEAGQARAAKRDEDTNRDGRTVTGSISGLSGWPDIGGIRGIRSGVKEAMLRKGVGQPPPDAGSLASTRWPGKAGSIRVASAPASS